MPVLNCPRLFKQKKNSGYKSGKIALAGRVPTNKNFHRVIRNLGKVNGYARFSVKPKTGAPAGVALGRRRKNFRQNHLMAKSFQIILP
jgi:hypothetical protein